MSWETRNGNRYYYRAEKIDGRVVKSYIGRAGDVFTRDIAELEQTTSEYGRISRELVRRQTAALLADVQEAAAALDAYYQDVTQIADAMADLGGYHRHKRGEWRRRRMRAIEKARGGDVSPMAADAAAEQRQAEARAMKAAQSGDAAAVPAMRAALDRLMVQNGGYLPDALTSHDQLTKMFANTLSGKGKNLLRAECVTREMHAMAAQVAGPNPSPLESLLADRVAMCWAHVILAEAAFHGANEHGVSALKMGDFSDQIDAAQRRYLAAIKALAQVRRLQLPSVQIAMPGSTQVNVGDKQINMASTGTQQVNVRGGACKAAS